MKITKLSWAGIILESGSTRIYIDPLQNVEAIFPFVGAPRFPVVAVPAPLQGNSAVLITHIHADHYDRELLGRTLANCVIWGPAPVVAAAEADGLRAAIVRPYDSFYFGDFKITPLPTVDWVGEDQVSYVISDGKHTVLHGGDTNWHGYWWTFAQRFGPIAAAFLPVNGVVGALPGQAIISEMSGTMNPEQAVTATRILGGGVLVPIHYGLFHHPPGYNEFPDVENSLNYAASKQGVQLRKLIDGEIISL
jgi:L-ascorbate metabolism protein UlaG (beta-lactamase superfamily)